MPYAFEWAWAYRTLLVAILSDSWLNILINYHSQIFSKFQLSPATTLNQNLPAESYHLGISTRQHQSSTGACKFEVESKFWIFKLLVLRESTWESPTS